MAVSVPMPSDQQLADWKLMRHEPLQLIESVSFSEMGFTQRMVSLPGTSQYLLGGRTITLWTLGSTEPDHVFVDWRDQESVEFRDMAVAPSGKWFVATSSTGMLLLFDVATRKEIASKNLETSLLPSIAISPDSNLIATAKYNGQVTLWNAEGLREKTQFEVDSSGLKQLLFLSADHLLTAAENLAVWNADDGSKVRSLPGDRYYASLSLSPNQELFTYGHSKGIKVCRLSDFEEVANLPTYLALDELVIWQNDQRLTSVSGNMIRHWDLPSKRLIQVIDNRGSQLAGATWLADSKVLGLASLLRRTRFWATASDAAAVGKRPIQPAITYSDPPPDVPASVLQLAQIIDLRSFSRLPDADPLMETENLLRYTTQASLEDAKLFCRYALHQEGWTESAEAGGAYSSMTFSKHGFVLDCSVSEVPGMGTTISMTSLGNLDLRKVPHLTPLMQTTYESASTCIFSSKSDLLTLETSLLKAMVADGWVPYARLSAGSSETADQRALSFLKNSHELRVTIGKHVSDPGLYNIQYSAFPVTNSIPIPTGSTYIEFNGAPELQLVASTKQPIQELIDFFDSSMQQQGWIVQDSSRELKDDRCWLLYSRDQQDITIGLLQLENGWRRMTVGDLSSSGSFQLAGVQSTDDSANEPTGLEATDLPIVPSAQNVQYKKLEKVVSFDVPDFPLVQLIQFYEKKLAELGWSKNDRSMVEAEFCYVDFAKGDDEITVRGNVRNGVASCNIQGDGLLWIKQLPGPKATVSYETWLRTRTDVASLEFLDQYVAEMQAIQEMEKSE